MAADAIIDAAIDWRIQLAAGSDADWEAFAYWLAAAPAHVEAYDVVTSAEASTLLALADMPVAANDAAPPRRLLPRLAALGGIAAAAVATLAVLPSLLGQSYLVSTAPGEHRTVTVEGATIAMNGGTLLRLNRVHPRAVAMLDGEAHFSVIHDPRAPFTIDAGATRITDVGTEFNVARGGSDLRVAVERGEVALACDGAQASLLPGQTARVQGRQIVIGEADLQAIGGWQRSRLTYQAASIGDIAVDVARTTGLHLAVEPAAGGRTFTGVIKVGPDKGRMLADLASLLNVEVKPSADGWTLAARTRASR